MQTISTLIPPLFTLQPDDVDRMVDLCERHADVASVHPLGKTDEGRHIMGFVLGKGADTVSLVAGAHSDEPVAPRALGALIQGMLSNRSDWDAWLRKYRFVIVPHVNPDGEARNRVWMDAWPSIAAYLRWAFREPPGRDIEFGYPAMRPENRMVAAFLAEHGPYVLHASLHGMGFSDGASLLIERHWSFRTAHLQASWSRRAAEAGLPLHDHNRKGEKGFFYIAPGYMTTPEGAAMQMYFRARGDEDTARLFHLSSMEYVRSLGGDPLCLVTELPLFLLPFEKGEPGVPKAYHDFRDQLPEIRRSAEAGEDLQPDAVGVRPLDPAVAGRLQLDAIELGLEQIALNRKFYG